MKPFSRIKASKGRFSAKISMRIFLLVTAVSFSFIAVFVRHQGKSLSDNLIKDGLSTAKLVSYNLRLGVYSEIPELLKGPMEGLMGKQEIISVSVHRLDGDILSTEGMAKEINQKELKEITERLTRIPSPYYQEKDDYFEFWAPILSSPEKPSEESLFYDIEILQGKNRVIGFLHFDMGKAAIKRSYKALLIQGILIAVIFLISGLVVAEFLAKRVTDPLQRLNRGAKAIGEGTLDMKIPVETEDEIGNLASAFNNMAELLKKRETEKQKLTDQLGRSQRLESIGTLAGGLAHDFNNILAITQSNIELASAKAPAYLYEYMEKALKAIGRGTDLVSQLLNYSHVSPATFEAVNIGLITQETFRLIEGKTRPGTALHIDIEPGIWKVRGDAGQLQDIIMNLYSNADDAIAEEMERTLPGKSSRGEKSFSVHVQLNNVVVTEEHCKKNPEAAPGKFVLLSFRDNGCGMDEQTRARLFEPFFTTKQVGKGTGLGLSTVYGLVKRHGGWVDVRSEKGKGSAFEIYLPRHEGKKASLAPSQDKPRRPGGKTVLLVDDEEHILDAMNEKLGEIGYTTLCAHDGEEAIAVLKEQGESIDLIVLDYIMPGKSGMEVLQHIRHNGMQAEVIIYTGKDLSQHSHFLKGIEVIRKPCNLDVLVERIRSTLGDNESLPVKSHINRVKFYYIEEKTSPHSEVISDVSDAYRLFRHIASEPRESFLAVFLDSRNRLIAYDALSSGTNNESVVYPKEVVRAALLTNASSVIILHNHPSGGLNPSEHDVIITAAISQACNIMGIQVSDHLIISSEGYFSFSREGLL